jgi:NADH-quinone oxidoreductase subunit M
VLGLWGVVISAVYMLRAYRAVFMGAICESCRGIADLRASLRVPIGLLVAITIWFGFFPQAFVRLVTPTFKSYFTAKQ